MFKIVSCMNMVVDQSILFSIDIIYLQIYSQLQGRPEDANHGRGGVEILKSADYNDLDQFYCFKMSSEKKK